MNCLVFERLSYLKFSGMVINPNSSRHLSLLPISLSNFYLNSPLYHNLRRFNSFAHLSAPNWYCSTQASF
jgi:hypothetical protein